MRRMLEAADFQNLEIVIRVTHDKIFVDPDLILSALETFRRKGGGYMYSSQFADGTGFEIISRDVLEKACAQFANVEHISYAVRAVSPKIHFFHVPEKYRSSVRLLIDYPEDLDVMELLLSYLGNNSSLENVLRYCGDNQWINRLNELPMISVYTCVKDGRRLFERCAQSVISQIGFNRFEYIIVDDHSYDSTTQAAYELASRYKNVKVVRNPENIGLASSSNIALARARGEYIIRLDADDYFVGDNVLTRMRYEMGENDVLYSDCYHGSYEKIQRAKDIHHVGGAMFSRRALNHVKFTDGLRGHEGLDLFLRARNQLKIGYFSMPGFFYTQRSDSMSKTNPEEREAIKNELIEKARSYQPAQVVFHSQ